MPPDIISVHPAALLPPSTDLREARDPEHVARLASAMRAEGFTGTILGRKRGDKLEVVWGETRRQAALQAGLSSIPVQVVERDLTEAESLLLQLEENDIRSDFTALERAHGYQRLMQLNKWSQAELAAAVHTSTAEVSKTLAISKRLPGDLQEMVASGDLCPAIAYQLSRLSDPAQMRELADKAAKGLLKRDSVEVQVTRLLGKRVKKAKPIKARTGRGVAAMIPDLDYDGVLAELGSLVEAVKKAQRHGLPLASLPSLLKG